MVPGWARCLGSGAVFPSSGAVPGVGSVVVAQQNGSRWSCSEVTLLPESLQTDGAFIPPAPSRSIVELQNPLAGRSRCTL